MSFTITDNTPISESTISGSWNRWKIRMTALPCDKINYQKVTKYASVLIFKEFYPKTKNVSYYLKNIDIIETTSLVRNSLGQFLSFLIKIFDSDIVKIILLNTCKRSKFVHVIWARSLVIRYLHFAVSSIC